MLRRLIFFILGLIFVYGIAVGQESGFGLGVIVGEPTGLSWKFWTGSVTAVDGAAAWSFADKSALHLHADLIFHDFTRIYVEKGKFPLYFGFGGRIKLEKKSRIGIRIPLGITYIPERLPLDMFLEIVPILDLVPGTEFDFNAAIGIRYFFK
ncbi:hypothetical protein KA005_07965 [bacterium]|nr:hypothetical protein [bacterium]